MSSQLIIQQQDYNNIQSTIQLKQILFQLFTSINVVRCTNTFFGILLLFLSFSQIASIIKFHLPNEEIDEYQYFFRPLSIILNYIIYLYPDQSSPHVLYSVNIIIYCFTAFVILLLTIAIYSIIITSRISTLPFTLLRYILQVYQWILFVPIIQVLLQSINGSNVSIVIIHLLLMLFYIIIQFIVSYFNTISSAAEIDFFNVKEALVTLNYFFIQLITFTLGIIAYDSTIFLFIAYIIIGGLLINLTFVLFNNFAFYSRRFLRTCLIMVCMLYERLLNSILMKYTIKIYGKPFHTYYVNTITVMVLSYFLIERIFFTKVIDYSLKHNVNKIKSSKEFVFFFISLNTILQAEPKNREFQIKKVGIAINHMVNCSNEEHCLLKSDKELYQPKEQLYSNKNVEPYYDNIKCLFMIKEMFNKYYRFYQFYFDFCLCYILFLIYTIGNNELALSEIEMSKRFVSLSLSQEFIMFLMKEYANYQILSVAENQGDIGSQNLSQSKEKEDIISEGNNNQQKMPSINTGSVGTGTNKNTMIHTVPIDNDHKKNKNKTNNISENITDLSLDSNRNSFGISKGEILWTGITLHNVINYDKLSTDIKNYIYLYLDTKKELWKLFLNDKIILEEIFITGQKFFQYKTHLTILWKELNLICNNQPDNEITRIYCDYLDKLCDDKIESRFILEKNQVFISNINDELYNNRFKADTGIVIIEGNCAINPGRITYINQPLISMLGYHKNELVDNNIKSIIPGDIGRYHDEIITNYFEKGRSDILKKTMNTLSVKSKEKYLIPIHLLVSILPNLGKKMEGIGLIRPVVKKRMEMVITNENGIIEALTEKMGLLWNITPSLIEKSHIYVQTYFPELMKPDKGSIPKFFSEECFNKNKVIDFKLDICCPSKNMIDITKYKLKIRNIYINQVNTIANGNDFLSNKALPKGRIGNDNMNQLQFGNMSQTTMLLNKANENLPIGYPTFKSILPKNINNGSKNNFNRGSGGNVVSPSNLGNIEPSKSYTPHYYHHNNNDNINNYTQSPTNTPGNIKATRSLFTQAYGKINQVGNKKKNENLIHFSPSNDQLTPDMELLIKYRDLIPTISSPITNADLTSASASKLIDIYNSILLVHDYQSLTEKAEVSLIHLGMRIYNNSIPIRIIIIPSEMLYEEKKTDEEDYSFISDINIAEKKNDDLIQHAAALNEEENEMEQMLEGGSVAGKDTNLALQKHLKKLRKEKTDNFLIHKFIGFLMALTVILTELSVILISSSLFQYVNNFNALIKESFAINTYLLDIAKYSIIEQFGSKFAVDNYGINATHLRIERSKQFLSLIDTYYSFILKIYDYDKMNENYNKKSFNFLLTNHVIKMSFINSSYKIISDAIDGSNESLKSVSDNFITSVNEHFMIIDDLFNNHYKQRTKLLYISQAFLLTFSLIILIGFMLILLYSYKTKRSGQTKLLSAYEQIKNEEIEQLLTMLDGFEMKYLEYFKTFDEYNTKKITFHKENTQFLYKKYQNRMKRDSDEEKKRITYNILSNIKVEEEIEEKTHKTLINRKNMATKYIIAFLIISLIVIIYTLFFYVETYKYHIIIQKTQLIIFNLFLSKFLLNYQSFKLENIVYKRMNIISNFDENSEKMFKQFNNMTHAQFNYLAITISNNPHLFKENITDVMTGNICSLVSIDYCKWNNEDLMRGYNGMRSIASFYFQSIDDSYLFYLNNYKSINDIGRIISSAQFTIQRVLIENLQVVYDEIFMQLNATVDNLFKEGIVNLIGVSIAFGGLFIICLLYKLSSFIEGIKQEESLCLKLIVEIPYDIVKENYDIQKQLKWAFNGTDALIA